MGQWSNGDKELLRKRGKKLDNELASVNALASFAVFFFSVPSVKTCLNLIDVVTVYYFSTFLVCFAWILSEHLTKLGRVFDYHYGMSFGQLFKVFSIKFNCMHGFILFYFFFWEEYAWLYWLLNT